MNTITKIIAATAFAAAAPALAAGDEDVRSMEVSYADLNLLSPEGLDRFDQRLRQAARIVCGATSPVNANANEAVQMRICQRKTLERAKMARDLAVANADNPQLAAAGRSIRLANC